MKAAHCAGCQRGIFPAESFHYIDESNRAISNSAALCYPCYTVRHDFEGGRLSCRNLLLSGDQIQQLDWRERFIVLVNPEGSVLMEAS